MFKPRNAQRTFFDARLHGAARLTIVTAVSEAAMVCQGLNVRKRLRNSFVRVPKLQFTQARRVHEQSPTWQGKDFSCGCGVSPATIGFTDFLHLLNGAP